MPAHVQREHFYSYRKDSFYPPQIFNGQGSTNFE